MFIHVEPVLISLKVFIGVLQVKVNLPLLMLKKHRVVRQLYYTLKMKKLNSQMAGVYVVW